MLIKHSLRRAALLLATSLLLAARPALAQDGEALRLEPAAETLIERGVKNSAELAQALAKLREAEAELGIARAEGGPKLDLKADAGKAREHRSSEQESTRSEGQRRQASLGFRWELDLFGRQRARGDAALAQQAAVEADLQTARLALSNSLRAELVRLRSATLAQRQRGELLATLLQLQQLEQLLQASGLRSAADQLELSAELEQRRAELAQQEQQRQHALLRLVRLSDIQAPAWRALADGPLPARRIEAQLPLQSLAQRPDVQAAEARLRGSIASAQAAKTALWPSLALEANVQRLRHGGLAGALRDSTDRFLGLGLAWALLDGGERRAQRDAAQARAELAAAEFRRVVLEAAEETEGALARALELSAAAEHADRAARQSHQASQLAEQRYRLGIDSLLQRLRQDRQALERELLAQELRGEQLQAALRLERALGRP